MTKYEETADKKISRKVAREWRKDIIKRSVMGRPDPHLDESKKKYHEQDRGYSRFKKAEQSGKFRGYKEASSPNKYYLGKEYAGGGRATRGLGKAFMKGGKVK